MGQNASTLERAHAAGFSPEDIQDATDLDLDSMTLSPARAALQQLSKLEGEGYLDIDPQAPKLRIVASDEGDGAEGVVQQEHENPFKTLKRLRKTVRAKKHVDGDLLTLLDERTRAAAWYCLPLERDSAVSWLQKHASKLPDGTFIVVSSGQDFVNVVVLEQGTTVSFPIVNQSGQLSFKTGPGDKRAPRFACMWDLVEFYTKKPRPPLKYRLQPDALNGALDTLYARAEIYEPEYLEAEPGDIYEYPHVSQTVSADYASAQAHPDYQMAASTEEATDGKTKPRYANRSLRSGTYEDMTDVLGFISFSDLSFSAGSPVCGVRFRVCQNDEFFYIGLSNIERNHHGLRDCHYDDIDFCIFCRGNGLATARECDDEVGPSIPYEPSDIFSILVSEAKGITRVKYLRNDKCFYSSTRTPMYPLWVDQAYHPRCLGKTLVSNVSFVFKKGVSKQ